MNNQTDEQPTPVPPSCSEVPIGAKVRLTKDIYDDGADHHPPGYIAHTGETVVVRNKRPNYLAVSHEHITDRSFLVYPGEFEVIPNR